jgi:hypothetical protein
MVLKQPGLNFGKCAILIGAPDWPTSVLCGLLKCDWWQVQVGTSPIIVAIAPLVMSGAFYLQPEDEAIWPTLASLMMTLSAVILGIFGVL